MAPFATLRTYLEMIAFSHTLFALPFAFMSAILAADGVPPARMLAWILAAMVGARSGAMGVNRLADRKLDALNPRTRARALPQGRISPARAGALVVASFGLFLLAAWQLNPLCLALAPLAILIVSGYSYTKRFTALSHLILGLSLALAPLGAWIAVTGGLRPAALLLGAAVLLWAAGFDTIYALLDVEFDRGQGLYSIPARLGVAPALWLARLFHLCTLGGLALLIPLLNLGWIYGLGLLLAGGLLATEHVLLHRHGLAKLNLAFFNVNGALSLVMLVATLLDRLLK